MNEVFNGALKLSNWCEGLTVSHSMLGTNAQEKSGNLFALAIRSELIWKASLCPCPHTVHDNKHLSQYSTVHQV